MPIPTRQKNEQRDRFISRCMANGTMRREYPDQQQRLAVCNRQADKPATATLKAYQVAPRWYMFR